MINHCHRRYLTKLGALLKEFYSLDGEEEGLKHRLKGIVHAGKVTFLVNNSEIQTLIDPSHYESFGMPKKKNSLTNCKTVPPRRIGRPTTNRRFSD